MLVEQYPLDKRFEELARHFPAMDPALVKIDQYLEDEKLYSDGSSKIDLLLDQVETKASHHKVLIFSQFVGMLNLIRKEFVMRKIEFEYLTGSTKDRKAVVENFQQNEQVRVFLISLKAGGVGLNLTEAYRSNVLFSIGVPVITILFLDFSRQAAW